MRTTVRIDDNLLAEARKQAADVDQSLSSLLEDALRAWLARKRPEESQKAFSLTTYKGKGLQPGIDLDNSGSLFELMDHVDVST